MKTSTNINQTAMKLAHLLHKAHKVMTAKPKTFSHFLGIAYKMLRNRLHYTYVLVQLRNINKRMLTDKRITVQRFNLFGGLYIAIRHLATSRVRAAVSW